MAENNTLSTVASPAAIARDLLDSLGREVKREFLVQILAEAQQSGLLTNGGGIGNRMAPPVFINTAHVPKTTAEPTPVNSSTASPAYGTSPDSKGKESQGKGKKDGHVVTQKQTGPVFHGSISGSNIEAGLRAAGRDQYNYQKPDEAKKNIFSR